MPVLSSIERNHCKSQSLRVVQLKVAELWVISEFDCDFQALKDVRMGLKSVRGRELRRPSDSVFEALLAMVGLTVGTVNSNRVRSPPPPPVAFLASDVSDILVQGRLLFGKRLRRGFCLITSVKLGYITIKVLTRVGVQRMRYRLASAAVESVDRGRLSSAF